MSRDDADPANPDARRFSEQPTVSSESKPLPTTQLGPYRLLEVLGEGGMGAVYLAEQSEPIRRTVALKLIKLGLDSKEVLARFEIERQALALMNHPNIARILDAGLAQDGRPYFVMEHVAGLPITEYCDRHRLNIEQRLQLFHTVCLAVHHAHQKGIVHRDLKPTNILIAVEDGGAVPKIIDFGLAKALHQHLTIRTVFTEQGRLLGTPAYMSPEQAAMTGMNVDITSDIYSLGVVLYELLTGVLPFDTEYLLRGGLAAMDRILREIDPPRPSARVSSLGDASAAVASRRRAEPRVLERRLRGELDWITMKAMEKDRTGRYQSAFDMAKDVTRFLTHEAVEAGPPHAGYRLRKLIRRHRGVAVAVGGVTVALLIGIVATSLMYIRAERARKAAIVARREAEWGQYVNSVRIARLYLEKEQWGVARQVLDRCPPALRDWEWWQLRRELDQSAGLLSGHRGPVVAVSFSPSGELIASGSCDSTIRVWDAGSRRCLKVLRGHTGFVFALTFTPDGQRVISSSLDSTVRVWDVPTGRCSRVFRGHSHAVMAVTCSPTGHWIASWGTDSILVWDPGTGRVVCRQVSSELGARVATIMAPDGEAVVIADGQFVEWRPPAEQPGRSATRLRGISQPAGSRTAEHIVATWRYDSLRLWDMGQGRLRRTIALPAPSVACVLMPNRNAVIAGLEDGTVRIYDVSTGKAVAVLRGHDGEVACVAATPRDELVATGGVDGAVLLWNRHSLSAGSIALDSTRATRGATALSADGSLLAGAAGPDVWLADLETGTRFATLHGRQDTVRCVDMTGNGGLIAAGTGDGVVELWDVRRRALVTELSGHAGSVNGLAFSPDGTRLISASEDGSAIVWNAATGDSMLRLHHGAALSDVRISDVSSEFILCGSYLAAWSAGGDSLDGFSIETAGQSTTKAGDMTVAVGRATGTHGWDQYLSVATHPRGRFIACGRRDGGVDFFDAKSRALAHWAVGGGVAVTALTFSSSGARVLAGGSDGSLRVLDVAHGDELLVLKPHSSSISRVGTSRNGHRVVTSATDGSVRVFTY